MKFSLRAPAKINWFLSITGKREDGYHDIVSPIQCVSLFDTLSFGQSPVIELISDFDLPTSENLVYKAAVRLKEYASSSLGAVIRLNKLIPSAAGLGGGSSDAATALIGLNRLWGLDLGRDELMKVGSEIGSDIPFFIDGSFSLVQGRGEKVTPLRPAVRLDLLLVKPPVSVSTAWAYAARSPELTKKSVDIKLFCQTLERKDFPSLRKMIFNDLERAVAAEHRVIDEIKRALVENGAVLSSMSGSGPTVFGLFRSREEALSASGKMGGHWTAAVETLI